MRVDDAGRGRGGGPGSGSRPPPRSPSCATVETEVLGQALGPGRAQPAARARCRPRSARTRAGPINAVRQALTAAVDERRAALEAERPRRRLEAERLDLTEVVGRPSPGATSTWSPRPADELEDVFVGMGYSVAEGPEVETDWYNFEALNMPPAHPARSMWDTLYVKLGEPESTLLRTHTSPVQIRVMDVAAAAHLRRRARPHLPPRHARRPPPARVPPDRGPGRRPGHHLRRPGRHHRGLHQRLLRPNITSRLRPSYFPFTEPSAEFEVTCIFCEGEGCRVCSQSGWIELGGCGMVDPNVFEAVGIDPEEWSGLRLRLRHRPLRHAPPRHRRHPPLHRQRHPLPRSSSEDRPDAASPCSWLPRLRARSDRSIPLGRLRPSTLSTSLGHGGRGRGAGGGGARRGRRGPGAGHPAHPDADKVQLVDVDAGRRRRRSQIVCGAFNFGPGDLVPLATVGARLPERHGDRPAQGAGPVVERDALLARRSWAWPTTTPGSWSSTAGRRAGHAARRRPRHQRPTSCSTSTSRPTGPTPCRWRAWPATWPPSCGCPFAHPRARRRSRATTAVAGHRRGRGARPLPPLHRHRASGASPSARRPPGWPGG